MVLLVLVFGVIKKVLFFYLEGLFIYFLLSIRLMFHCSNMVLDLGLKEIFCWISLCLSLFLSSR